MEEQLPFQNRLVRLVATGLKRIRRSALTHPCSRSLTICGLWIGCCLSEAHAAAAFTKVLTIQAEGIPVALRCPGGWSVSGSAGFYQMINLPAERVASLDAAALASIPQIIITTER